MNRSSEQQNPFRPPESSAESVPESGFFALDSTRLEVVELWRLSSNFLQFAFLVILKTLRRPVNSLVATRVPQSLKPLDLHELDPVLQSDFEK